MNEIAQIHRFPIAPPEGSLAELLRVSFVSTSAEEPLEDFLAEIGISLWLLREERQPFKKSVA